MLTKLETMKNLKIYSLILFGFVMLNACDPLGDEIEEIGISKKVAKDIDDYVLTKEDYDFANGICGCSGFENFSDEEDAKVNIPLILANNFPNLGDESFAKVYYDYYHGSSPDLRGTQNIAIVSDDEYEELGFSFGNFSNLESDIPTYATYKYPDAEDGDFADISHAYWTGSSVVDTVSRGVYSVAYGWMYAYVLPDDEYGDFFGESGIDFSFEDEGVEKMPVYIKETQKFASEGDRQLWQFNYDDDGPVAAVVIYIYDGTTWNTYGDVAQTTQELMSLSNDGSVWLPDNTIKYTLTGGDYTSIGEATASSNPSGSASVLQYSNFDLTLWTSEEIFDAVAAQMMIVYPNTPVDQKYSVSYATWEPGAGTGTVKMIWDGTEYQPVE